MSKGLVSLNNRNVRLYDNLLMPTEEALANYNERQRSNVMMIDNWKRPWTAHISNA